MTPAPANPPSPGAGHPPTVSDAGRWREAARLRLNHPGWAILWLASAGEFRAYRRLPGQRRDSALSAPTAEALAEKITQAEQPALTPRRRSGHD